MANKTIPQLPLQTGVTDLDLFAIVDSGETITSSIKRSEFMSGATNTTFQNVTLTDSSNITLEENGGTGDRSFIVQNKNYPLTSNANKQIGIMTLNTTIGGYNDVTIGGNQTNMTSTIGYKTNLGGWNGQLSGDKSTSVGGYNQVIQGYQSSMISCYNNAIFGGFSTSISCRYGDNTDGEHIANISNHQQNTTYGDYIATISNYQGQINTTGTNCGQIVCTDSYITGSTEHTVMLACSGRTATSNFTTYVETLEAYQGIVMTDYANLNFTGDTAAAAGGVPLGGLYHNSGAMRIRIT